MVTESQLFRRIGKAIRRVRLERGASQTEVARKIGSYQQNVARAERGTENLTLDLLARFGNALGVDPSEFFRVDEPASKKASPGPAPRTKRSVPREDRET